MAKLYLRYEKLQKYYLGVPIDPPEYKKGDLISNDIYTNLDSCENNYIYRWFPIEGEYICDNGEKYAKEIKQVKRYDEPDNMWRDVVPEETRQSKEVIEHDSADCGVSWVETDIYVCDIAE